MTLLLLFLSLPAFATETDILCSSVHMRELEKYSEQTDKLLFGVDKWAKAFDGVVEECRKARVHLEESDDYTEHAEAMAEDWQDQAKSYCEDLPEIQANDGLYGKEAETKCKGPISQQKIRSVASNVKALGKNKEVAEQCRHYEKLKWKASETTVCEAFGAL